MNPRRSLAWLIGFALVASACSGIAASTTSSSTTLAALPPPTNTTPELPSTTTTTSASTSSTTLQIQEVDAALVGDIGGGLTLFPDSGNGGYEVSVYDLTPVLSDDLAALECVASITAVAGATLASISR